mmetsp:Transcript_29954/g.48781  ORF Transcript_29954/g.48781 Transcript_29954/m.48781 type:complete len:446 (+) Transcript_29954:134-1471(+)
MGAGSSSSSEGWKGMDRVDEKAHTYPQKQKILMDLYKAYARTDHIGKSRTRDFARDLVRWHVKKKHLRGDDIDVKKEVYRIINFFDVGREGRIYKGALLTQVGGQVLLNYNFNHTYNRRRTQHVLQATMHDILGKKEVEIILSYTQEWGHHKGAYIGYGVKNGYWRNGWGWDTFNTATPHKSHARSHGRKGDGLSHWSCCGNVDKFDKFCYNYSIPLVQPPSPLSSSSSAAASSSLVSQKPIPRVSTSGGDGDPYHVGGGGGGGGRGRRKRPRTHLSLTNAHHHHKPIVAAGDNDADDDDQKEPPALRSRPFCPHTPPPPNNSSSSSTREQHPTRHHSHHQQHHHPNSPTLLSSSSSSSFYAASSSSDNIQHSSVAIPYSSPAAVSSYEQPKGGGGGGGSDSAAGHVLPAALPKTPLSLQDSSSINDNGNDAGDDLLSSSSLWWG